MGVNRYGPYPTSQPVSLRHPATQYHGAHGVMSAFQPLTDSCDALGTLNSSGTPRSSHSPYAVNYEDDDSLSQFPKYMDPPFSLSIPNSSLFGPRTLGSFDSRSMSGFYPSHNDFQTPVTMAAAYLGSELSPTSLNGTAVTQTNGGIASYNRHRPRGLPTLKRPQQVHGSRMSLEQQSCTPIGNGALYHSSWPSNGFEDLSGSKQSSDRPGSFSFGSSGESSSLTDPSSAATTVESVRYPTNPHNSPVSPTDSHILPVDPIKPGHVSFAAEMSRVGSHPRSHDSASLAEPGKAYEYTTELHAGQGKSQVASTGAYLTNGALYARASPAVYDSASESYHKSRLLASGTPLPVSSPALHRHNILLSNSPSEITPRCLRSTVRRSYDSASSSEAY